MGIFKFLKDEKNEYGDSHKGSADGFDLSNFSNNAELIDWIEENKVILLSEKEGLVVYTNDIKENFLQLYTSTENVVDEVLDEYVEITGADLRDLLDEMTDISYLVLNPSQENILIQREEVLRNVNHQHNHRPLPRRDEEFDDDVDLEMTRVINVPLDFSVDNVRDNDNEQHEGTVSLFDPNKIDDFSLEETFEELEDKDQDSDEDELETSEYEDEYGAAESEEIQEFLAQQDGSEEIEEDSKFRVAKAIPQSIIQNILKLSKEVQKFYLAENISSDGLYFMAATTAEVKLDEDLLGVTVLSQDGSEESFELENEKYLIYDSKKSKKLSTNYSEVAVLSYFKDMPVVYPLPDAKTPADANEITVFTDFSQIPTLFLNAFESFELASVRKFSAFLDKNPEIELVRLNPFTKSLALRPEAFKSQEIEIDDESFGKTITVETDKKGKQNLITLLNLLLDFRLTNISISRNEKKFIFEFATEKDVVIARQILKLKTKHQIS